MASNYDIARQYSKTRLMTATHPQIISLIHANCVTLIKQSAMADPVHRRNLIIHAQNLLAELEGSLNVTDELSRGLFYLYDYCYCLLETEVHADHNLALSVLSLLRDTFGFLLKKHN
jgi:flagellin-specific chaperone FliS